MKKKLLSLLTLSLTVLTLSNCSFVKRDVKTVPIIHTKIVKSTIIKCPRPEKPLYKPLDESKPLLDKKNLQILLYNIAKMKNYCEELELTIECYEHQLNTIESTSTKGGKKDVK